MLPRGLTRMLPVAMAILLAAASLGFADKAERSARDEMDFGFKAAREGYWQEALMRFRNADRLTPNQPRILNNIAVALEVTGDYDGARETYARALTMDPGNRVLRGNVAAFEEFYEANVAEPEKLPDADEQRAEGDPADAQGSDDSPPATDEGGSDEGD